MNSNPNLHNSHLEGDSFLWQGNATGILLSHGYTATTAEVRPLAEELHKQGYTVAGPLLPGHGTDPKEMNRCGWQDWAGAMEKTYQELSTRCDHVFVGGESMGGLLALYLASQHPESAGVLAYAPVLKIHKKPLLLSYMLAPLVPHVAKKNANNLNKRWKGYRVNPLPAIVQMHKLQRQVRRCLPKIRQPLLIVQGRLDREIDLQGINTLYREAGSTHKELHWMEHSNHVVILDKEREQVTDLTLQFIKKVLNGSRE